MAGWREALSVVSNVLGVISSAASTPGINLIPYVSTIAAGANALQAALKVGINIAPYIAAIRNTFAGGLPSEADHKALRDKIAELEAQVDAPLPPAEAGEPE